MAISGVGTNYYQAGTPTFAVNVSPAAVGNCFLLYTNFNDITKTVTGIAGGGALNWTNVASYNAAVYRHELWLGQPVKTLGIQAVTLTFSGPMTTTNVEIDVQEFTNGNMATVWAVDGSQTGHVNDATNQTTITFASLTPSLTIAELYYGAARDGTGTAVAGSTTGYTYQINAAGNVILYNENVTAASSPTCTESPAGPYTSISALITATVWGDIQGGTAGPSANAQPGGIAFAFGSDVTIDNRIEAKVELNEQTGPGQISLSSSGTATMGQWIRVTEAHITVSGYDCVAESWTAVVLGSGSLTVTAKGADTSQQWQMSMCCRERSGLSTADDITCVDTSVISAWNASPFQVTSPVSISGNGLASVGYFDVGSNHTITAGTGFTLRNFSGASGTCETALEDVGFGPAGATVTGQWNGWDPGTSRCLDVVLYRQVNDPGPNVVYPDGDAAVNSWTTDTGATTNLWQSVSESPASDANYVQSPQTPTTSQYYEALLQGPTAGPIATQGIVAHYRYEGSTAAPLGMRTELIQGAISAPAFATVGALVDISGSGVSTVSVTTHAIGNAWLLLVRISAASPIAVAGITGGGATWQRVAGPFYDNSGAADEEIWLGMITSIVASNNIVVTYNGSVTGVTIDLDVQEFSSSLGATAVWSVDVSGTLNNPSSTNQFWPSLTNTGESPELYFGYCRVPGSMTGTPQTGVVFTTDLSTNVVVWDLSIAGRATLQPKGTSGSAQLSWSIAVLIRVGVIAAWTVSSLTTSWAQSDQALTAAQGASILDFTNLRYRFTPGGGYNNIPDNERIAPDAILLQTNLIGAVSAIQDDPTAPDATWLTATSNSAASILRVSTPTPAATPIVGAGLQTFRAWLRKKGGTGTPTATLELWESGSLKSTVLAATNITSTTGQLISGTWNASSLTTASGVNAEIRITGTVGGSGGQVATIEVGAVDWVSTETGQVRMSWASLDLPSGAILRGRAVLQAVNRSGNY